MYGEALAKPPTILLVGDYMWPWYQEACARALEILGCRVIRFGWFSDFWRWIPERAEPVYCSVYQRAQYRYQFGPTVWRINRRLLRIATQFKPDLVWFYNVTLISPAIVKKLRALLPDAIFCQYCNDNPFSPLARPELWRHFIKSIPYFDIHFTYRHSNIADYYRLGAHNVELLRSYFVPHEDYPARNKKFRINSSVTWSLPGIMKMMAGWNTSMQFAARGSISICLVAAGRTP